MSTTPRTIRVAVTNPGSGSTVPRPRTPTLNEEGGRGLNLIESLATAWGYREVDGGMEVWFEMDAQSCDATP